MTLPEKMLDRYFASAMTSLQELALRSDSEMLRYLAASRILDMWGEPSDTVVEMPEEDTSLVIRPDDLPADDSVDEPSAMNKIPPDVAINDQSQPPLFELLKQKTHDFDRTLSEDDAEQYVIPLFLDKEQLSQLTEDEQQFIFELLPLWCQQLLNGLNDDD